MANPDHIDVLRRGVDEWNRWRLAHRDIMPDLSNAYLPGLELARANLAEADLSGARLRRVYASNINLRCANLNRAKLVQAYLREADLSGAQLIEAELMGASFYKANLSGANMTSADLSYFRRYPWVLEPTVYANGADLLQQLKASVIDPADQMARRQMENRRLPRTAQSE